MKASVIRVQCARRTEVINFLRGQGLEFLTFGEPANVVHSHQIAQGEQFLDTLAANEWILTFLLCGVAA